jgi:mannose-6-phosphate isomerase-like protein (cupin superfamily)
MINIANIQDAESWFQVLHTTKRSQAAVMTLKAEGKSSEGMNTHDESDQVVLIVEGEVEAEIGREKRRLRKGDTCTIPAGTPHRLTNPGRENALTFNVYTPPEYASNEQG